MRSLSSLALALIIAAVIPEVGIADQKNCDCYFGKDAECPDQQVCTKGFVTDKCKRRKPKGGAHHGHCTTDAPAESAKVLIYPCDGQCVPKESGSKCGGQSIDDISNSLDLWERAIIGPAESGGGKIDRVLAAQARAVPLTPECTDLLGWLALGTLDMAWADIIAHPDGHDELEDHVVPDLQGETCYLESGRRSIDAIVAGLHGGPAAVDPVVESIRPFCPSGLPANPGLPGDNVEGLKTRLRTTAENLVIPEIVVPLFAPLGLLVTAVFLLGGGWIAHRRATASPNSPAA